MSLKNVWERRHRLRHHLTQLNILSRAIGDDTSIDHINVAETITASGFVIPFGINAPACSAAFIGVKIRKVHPYVISSPRLCNVCLMRLKVDGLQ